jgi:hypothetical protein
VLGRIGTAVTLVKLRKGKNHWALVWQGCAANRYRREPYRSGRRGFRAAPRKSSPRDRREAYSAHERVS